MSKHILLEGLADELTEKARAAAKLTRRRILMRLKLERANKAPPRIILNEQLLLLCFRRLIQGRDYNSADYTRARRAALKRRFKS